MSVSDLPQAYATMITSDAFLMGLETMMFSLFQTGTSKPLLILLSSQVSKTTAAVLRRKNNVHVVRVEDIANPNEGVHVEGWINSGYTKLRLWEQEQYSKLVYVDADTLITENVDELFDRPDFSAAPDIFPPDKFNAGVMVLKPSRTIFEDMMSKIHTLSSHDGGDTGFLNSYFPEWYSWTSDHHLPFGYNAQRTMYWFTHKKPGYWQAIKPLKIIHYSSSPKPWEQPPKGDLELIWWEHFTRSKSTMSTILL